MTGLRDILKNVIICTTLIAFLSATVFGCGQAASVSDEAITIKIAVALAEDDFRCDYLRQFESDVEAGTDGRVQCELYYQDKYGDQLTIYEALKNKYQKDDSRFTTDYLNNEKLLEELHHYYFNGIDVSPPIRLTFENIKTLEDVIRKCNVFIKKNIKH